jgi:hypothetical protein
MLPNKNPWRILCIIRAFLLAFMMMILACSGVMPPPPQLMGKPVSVKKIPDLLQTCARITDHDLQDLRGCYDSYYFAMEIGITLGGSNPSVNVSFLADVPPGSAPTFNGNQASFNNGTVSFQAGAGNTSMGKGVFQLVSVAGNNNIVIASTNVNINVPSLTTLNRPASSFLRTPMTLMGLR